MTSDLGTWNIAASCWCGDDGDQPSWSGAAILGLMTNEVRAVLFDLGGVIVQLDSIHSVLGPSPLDADQLAERWILCEAVQQFERGQCGLDDFAAAVVAELSLQTTTEEFIERFRRFPQGMFPGAAELVASVPDGVMTGALSNTNALHWQRQLDAEVVQGLFDKLYLSFQLGMAKPASDIFDHAVADLGLRAEQVLFIDDNQINVDGARSAGLRADRAYGPEQTADVLRAHAIL